MKVLIFDTETTGLPVDWKIPAERQPNNWPHIVSIAWMVLDSETNTIETQKSYIVKPLSWIIPEESTAIHGIRHSFAVEYGVALKDVMKEFFETSCDMYVAHNMNFDQNVIINAIYWDLKGEIYKFEKPTCCTMKIATPMCRLRFSSGNGTKPPKLSELYEHVFRKKPILSRLHGSFYDTKILTDIIQVYEPIRVALGLVAPKPILSNVPQSYASSTTLIL